MQTDYAAEFETRTQALAEHLTTIRRNMEQMMAENHRMREVVRIAENELRKRRDQVRQMEEEIEALRGDRREAKARVEHAMEQLDNLIANGEADAAQTTEESSS